VVLLGLVTHPGDVTFWSLITCAVVNSASDFFLHIFKRRFYILFYVVGLQVMPEDWWEGRRPPLPLVNKKVDIFIGEPMQFDIPSLKDVASNWVRSTAGVGSSSCSVSSNADDRKVSSFGNGTYNPHPLHYGVRRCSSFPQVAETLDKMREDGVDVPGPLLDEAAWRWIYTHITEHIWVALSDVTEKARTLSQLRAES